MNRDSDDGPGELSRRADRFVRVHGFRAASPGFARHRRHWQERGVPDAEIERAGAFDDRWGGLVLPPAPVYEGGPRMFGPDMLEEAPSGGWWFEAGDQRTSVAFSFQVGPGGEFGIFGHHWVPLHASVEGWVESVAPARHAALRAQQITKVTGPDVAALDLGRHEPVPEVAGLADQWWRGPDSLIAVHTGEAEAFARPGYVSAVVYSGLDDWGLRGG
ncbi:hypothetical protein OH807_34615 [Kitasatospora sp. NBC_01560]|uniref:hypothetical protein n=1 Tax=Kitasatospora sp. NBC_01560 TaxID=2975965 RepID=UPI0038667625